MRSTASMVVSQGFTYTEKGAMLQEFHPPAKSMEFFTLVSLLVAVNHVPQILPLPLKDDTVPRRACSSSPFCISKYLGLSGKKGNIRS